MSSGFVTETELAAIRQRKQEEWEKVRRPEDPMERPTVPYDSRSLFDQLKEQRTKKDIEYEEAHKLKNLIRGLDDDEVQFLEIVDKNKLEMEKKQMLKEEEELNDFRQRVASLQDESMNKKLQDAPKGKATAHLSTDRPTQKSLLRIGIKRKTIQANASPSKRETKGKNTDCQTTIGHNKDPKDLASLETDKLDKGYLKCVAILPGLGPYNDSSDSEVSSGSEDEPAVYDDRSTYDLLGRRTEKKKNSG